jgi:2'-5' RNA ligase
MEDYSGSIAIMFPANYPADKPDAHCTLIWLGYIDTFMFQKEDVLKVLNAFDYTPNPSYKALPPKIFGGGDDERVVVLPLNDEDGSLHALKDHIDAAFAAISLYSPSEYKDYVPHVTTEEYVPGVTKMAGYPVPDKIELGKAELWWGDEHVENS